MIKHIVFWQIKDELEKQIVMPKMKQMLVSLVGKIDGLVSAEVGFNYNGGDYDIALYSVFESKEALGVNAVFTGFDGTSEGISSKPFQFAKCLAK